MVLAVTTDVSGALLEPVLSRAAPAPDAIFDGRQRDTFRWEADMTALVAGQVHRLMPRGGAHLVVGEVPAAQGIADIAAVRFDVNAVRRRLDAGVGPVTLPAARAGPYLLREDRGVRASTLAARLGTNPPALMRSTLGPLAELGLAELERDVVRSTGVWRPVAAHVTAVELKLSKWRDALRQADNFATSADRAWVVLDAARSATAVRESKFIAVFGVGLAVWSARATSAWSYPPVAGAPSGGCAR